MIQPQIDDTLKDLALQAQKSPPMSPQRQRCLQRLIFEIQRSGKLGHPSRGNYPPDSYTELYNEALQRTQIKICTHIDRYNPEHPVMAWVNDMLKYAFIDVERERYRQGVKYIPDHLKNEKLFKSLEDLDQPLAESSEDAVTANEIRDLLEQDPDQKFQNTRMQKRPEITFQVVALARFVEGLTWSQLGDRLNISLHSLHSFFNRSLQQLRPYFLHTLTP